MIELWQGLLTRLKDPELLARLMKAAVIVVVGFLLTRLLILLLLKGRKKSISAQSRMLLRKTISYTGLSIVLLLALSALGINLAPLLGAAGILGIAIGFASQTSISNIISGFFLIAERPFEIGDVVKVNNITGIVKSVDLLSIKLRGFDNRYIRIPNETLIKTELMNFTRFPIRRVDMHLRIAYKEDLNKVQELLYEIVESIPECLDSPEPLFLMENFSERGVEFLFGVWIDKSQYIDAVNGLMMAVKEVFDREKIEIPYPHLQISMGPELNQVLQNQE